MNLIRNLRQQHNGIKANTTKIKQLENDVRHLVKVAEETRDMMKGFQRLIIFFLFFQAAI